MSNQTLAHIALLVNDYDEAIAFFIEKLHFDLIEDTELSETKRWVLVAPKGPGNCRLLLAKAANEEQRTRIGNQTGGRVFLFLHTGDFERDFNNLLDHGIKIVRGPVMEPYGRVAVFEDLYGNLWDLIGPAGSPDVSPKSIVRQWVGAFNRVDAKALAALYDEQAVNHQVNSEPLVGRAAIQGMFEREFAQAEMVCIVENLFGDGDWAILEWRDPLGLRGCGFFQVQGGKIVFQRGYWDKLSFLRIHGLPIPES